MATRKCKFDPAANLLKFNPATITIKDIFKLKSAVACGHSLLNFEHVSVLQCWHLTRQICPSVQSFSQHFAMTNSRTFWNLSILHNSACFICILFCAPVIYNNISRIIFNTAMWNSIQYMYCYLRLKHTAVITCTLPVAFTRFPFHTYLAQYRNKQCSGTRGFELCGLRDFWSLKSSGILVLATSKQAPTFRTVLVHSSTESRYPSPLPLRLLEHDSNTISPNVGNYLPVNKQ